MNIRDAAIQLEQMVRAYSARTPDGAYRVPLAAQRPVYLIGPPGVGKTAVVAQVAARLGIGFAAYTMTHHTRQSALGLPMIAHRTLGGIDRAVTEYTMSEIVADVWTRAEAGAETGLLFLDEINCVSESLMPAMLQLLQYKTFGVHTLPRGWMLVCAGNPPRYNRYAHTFDAVVLDRLRVVEVEPDFGAWQVFAAEHGVHPAIRSYLAQRQEDFYVADGDRIVTARSWTDLSDVMLALEAAGIAPDGPLFGQYLQVPEVAERFGLYFRLCKDLGGQLDELMARDDTLPQLPFDEAVFAALFVANRMESMAAEAARMRREAEQVAYFVDGVAREAGSGMPVAELCDQHIERRKKALAARIGAGLLDERGRTAEAALNARLERLSVEARGLSEDKALDALREGADAAREPVDRLENELTDALRRGLDFIGGTDVDPAVRLIFLNDLRGHGATYRAIRVHCAEAFDVQWKLVAQE